MRTPKNSKLNRKHEKSDKLTELLELLKLCYPEPKCELDYSPASPHELLIAARLSAQCTDKRVNMVTPALFDRFDTIKAFANADVATIENLVKTCGLYKTKAKSIKEMCQMLIERFDEEIPDTLTELLELPGVGRKTANLIIGELHGKPAIVADTHVIRLSNRLGLVSSKDPFKIEQALREIIPPNESMAFCHRLVLHGRRVCKARNPDCSECCLREACDFVG